MGDAKSEVAKGDTAVIGIFLEETVINRRISRNVYADGGRNSVPSRLFAL